MATYVIGDIHGCYQSLRNLLDRIEFDPSRDRLWLVGDLVNRGPRSLDVLRWAKENESRITAVLGNHDLHLLARARGLRPPKPRDTLDKILAAPDRDELLDWLRQRPLIHRKDPFVLVHAALLPSWTIEQAVNLAEELQAGLRGSRYPELLSSIYSNGSLEWRNSLTPPARWRSLANVFTYLRVCTAEGNPAYDYSGSPRQAPPGRIPWFAADGRKSRGATILFGHWAALGFHVEPGVVGLDSGCVWGHQLTAVRLPDLAVFQVPHADS